MEKVTTDHNWRDVDQLNGKDLTDKELLRIKWPDGTFTREVCYVEKSAYQTQDHNSLWTMHCSKAFIEIEHKGIPARLYLAGADLLCERLPK